MSEAGVTSVMDGAVERGTEKLRNGFPEELRPGLFQTIYLPGQEESSLVPGLRIPDVRLQPHQKTSVYLSKVSPALGLQCSVHCKQYTLYTQYSVYSIHVCILCIKSVH